MSVIIPVYNAARWVDRAARSALEQPETFEVLMIDDGSSDGSADVCRQLAAEDPRVKVLRHHDGGNHGPAASRNVGLRSARGRYVAFLDADDWYLPGRFTVSVPMLERTAELDGVYEAVEVVFEDDDARAEWEREPHRGLLITLPAPLSSDEVLTALVEGRGVFCTLGIVLRLTVFDRVGAFDESLAIGSDTAMWWKIAACHRLAAGRLTPAVAVYRRHRENRSSMRNLRYRDASVRVAATVWRWSRRRVIPCETRDRLAMALIDRLLSAPPAATGWRSVTARAVRLGAGILRWPEVLLVPALWVRVLRKRLLVKLAT